MGKIEYETSKFYPGYPVFVLMTKIENEVFMTTLSSSYTLRNQLITGMGKDGRTASNLAIGQQISVNYLTKNRKL